MLLAIIVKFDFKILQLNIINIFLYINLNKIIFIRMLFGYIK